MGRENGSLDVVLNPPILAILQQELLVIMVRVRNVMQSLLQGPSRDPLQSQDREQGSGLINLDVAESILASMEYLLGNFRFNMCLAEPDNRANYESP